MDVDHGAKSIQEALSAVHRGTVTIGSSSKLSGGTFGSSPSRQRGYSVPEKPSTHDVARPVLGDVHPRERHRDNDRGGHTGGPAQHCDEKRDARHVTTRERERRRRFEEWK